MIIANNKTDISVNVSVSKQDSNDPIRNMSHLLNSITFGRRKNKSEIFQKLLIKNDTVGILTEKIEYQVSLSRMFLFKIETSGNHFTKGKT